MKRSLKITLIILVIIVLLAAVIGILLTVAERNQSRVQEIVITDIDLSTVPDGTFSGKYSAFPVVVQVDVTVKDHAITAIDLVKHINGQGGDAEVVPGKVVEAQSLLVDTVSGATYSSKVILLAIQDALQKAANR